MSCDTVTLGPYFAGEVPEPVIYTFLKSDGTPLPLTGGTWTAKLEFRRWNATSVTEKTTGVAVLDQTNFPGQVTWPWVSADMAAAGDFEGELWATNSTNQYHSGDLCWLVMPTLLTPATAVGYASMSDFKLFTGQDPQPGIERKLQRAAELLDASLVTAVYSTDANGLPTDATIADAFKRAACAQVEWWLETDDDLGEAGRRSNANLGATGSWENVAIGPVPPTRTMQARGVGNDRLAPKAAEILRVAKLWNVRALAF